MEKNKDAKGYRQIRRLLSWRKTKTPRDTGRTAPVKEEICCDENARPG